MGDFLLDVSNDRKGGSQGEGIFFTKEGKTRKKQTKFGKETKTKGQTLSFEKRQTLDIINQKDITVWGFRITGC